MRLSLSLSSSHCFLPLSRTFSSMASRPNSLMWFRKGLRIHDNPALEYSASDSNYLYPVFVIDPHYMEPDPNSFSPGSARAGLNRIRFLLESLVDLDSSLQKLGSRLLVLKGEPSEVLIRCFKEWDIKKLCFEHDTEPYYQDLDVKIKKYASEAGIEVFSPVSHTLFNPADIIRKNGGRPPLSYQSFVKLAGQPSWASSPLSTMISSLPSVGNVGNCEISEVPIVKELGYEDIGQDELTPFKGGESEALKRLRESIKDKEWVANFEKPKGDPSAFLKPATTVLSPYLKFGCLSSRYFYQCIQDVQNNVNRHTSPPVSLLGQLLWRDFFYTVAVGTPNFDRMKDNRICKQYNRIYSPTSFGKKYDPNGNYIRHFLPVLKDMPKEYIYEPWSAPLSIQTKAKCIIGKDYPKPVVSHDTASKECKRNLAEAYELNRKLSGLVSEEELKNLRKKSDEDQIRETKSKRQKQKLIG
ncbi:(6-4)DNA photolyase isoform X3 [Cornus florida]|uniref:(6-4)DNA photolyase isoform X3 n=1 Tax=Cornus florida TaxID=4283 RepID=UPI0028A24A15|nr:(6-4)DNA photolyase isoform X3 [Cornus florida]